MHVPRLRRAVAALLVVVLASACGSPIRAVRVDPQRAHRVALRNELTSGELSQYTQNFIFQKDLSERFEKDPAGVLRDLHASFAGSRTRWRGSSARPSTSPRRWARS